MFGSHIQEKMLYHSADPEMTIARLKKGDIDKSVDVSDVQKLIDTYDIGCYIMDEPRYHFKCLKIPSKPYMLYTWGDVGLLDKNILGIVGPRKPSMYAERVMEKLFQDMNVYDIVTISGGAQGIDYLAHTYSFENNIPTIVVLGGGIGHYLKGSKRDFLKRIVACGGLVISEFKLWQEPTPWSFPQRNRIIAGLCDVLFFPAAGIKSGSLITVDFALGIRTPVYTVPGSIYEATSEGSNAYLEKGKVHAVISFKDMLTKYFNLYSREKVHGTTLHLTKQQKHIVTALCKEQMSSEYLAHILKKQMSDILGDLTCLEILGHISMGSGGKRYIR